MSTVGTRLHVCPLENRELCHTAFAASVLYMEQPPNSTLAFITGGRDAGELRNMAVKSAIKHDATHVLMLDSDMVYPQNTAARLLAHDVDVVCGFGLGRKPPHPPIAGGLTPDEEMRERRRYYWHPMWPTDTGDAAGKRLNGLCETTVVGGSALMIRLSVFDKLSEPWFRTDYQDGEMIGEDVYFSQNALDACIDLYMDADLPVAHAVSGFIQPLYSAVHGRWLRGLLGIQSDVCAQNRAEDQDGSGEERRHAG